MDFMQSLPLFSCFESYALAFQAVLGQLEVKSTRNLDRDKTMMSQS
jgi:hypothetical protein